MPQFDSLHAIRSGVVKNVLLPEPVAAENFGVQYTGYIKTPADGLYTFYLNSDDGTNLLLDGDLVVVNDGTHAATEVAGTIHLRAGYHEFKLGFFQRSGGRVLQASMEGPGMSKQAIPDGMLYRASE